MDLTLCVICNTSRPQNGITKDQTYILVRNLWYGESEWILVQDQQTKEIHESPASYFDSPLPIRMKTG